MSGPSIVCPDCGAESFNPNDVREGYCGRCHAFTRRAGARWPESEAMQCPAGHAMRVDSRFLFDHEDGDDERTSELLRIAAVTGMELGAKVTAWYCAECDLATCEFFYADEEANA